MDYDLNFSLFFTKIYHTASEVAWTTFMALFVFCHYYDYKLNERILKMTIVMAPIPVGTEMCKNAISTRLNN